MRYYEKCFHNIDKGILEIIGPQQLSLIYKKIVLKISALYQYGLGYQLFFIYNTLIGYFFILELFF